MHSIIVARTLLRCRPGPGRVPNSAGVPIQLAQCIDDAVRADAQLIVGVEGIGLGVEEIQRQQEHRLHYLRRKAKSRQAVS